jgi:hypothetical protein
MLRMDAARRLSIIHEMARRWLLPSALLLAGAAVYPSSAVADGNPQLTPNSSVHVALPAGGSAAYDVPGSGGTLIVSLASGDAHIGVQSDDGSTSMQTAISGWGTSTLGLGSLASGAYHLSLSSGGGADMSLQLSNTDSGGGQTVVTNTSGSSAGASVVSVSSGTGQSGSADVLISNGGGDRIEIGDGKIVISSDS